MNRIFPVIVVIIAIMLAVWFVIVHAEKPVVAPAHGNLIASLSYACDGGKTINASFYGGTSTPGTATQPPVPGGSVVLVLSDGRTATLPQTISADGGRYANSDESFIFWEKGSGAFLTENNQQTYANCLNTAKPSNPVSQTYRNEVRKFSLQLPYVDASKATQNPDAYIIDGKYRYQAQGPTKTIDGIKFMIPGTMATGTNLSPDSYIAVEQIPGLTSCTAVPFVSTGTKASVVTEGTTTYSMATMSDAAAGNRYDETVYAIASSSPCTAVRYFIHYAAFQNFPEGTVREFNEQEVVASFDAIRRTLELMK